VIGFGAGFAELVSGGAGVPTATGGGGVAGGVVAGAEVVGFGRAEGVAEVTVAATDLDGTRTDEDAPAPVETDPNPWPAGEPCPVSACGVAIAARTTARPTAPVVPAVIQPRKAKDTQKLRTSTESPQHDEGIGGSMRSRSFVPMWNVGWPSASTAPAADCLSSPGVMVL
jgi:hypothetical protein